MTQDRELLLEMRALLRRQEARANSKPNAEMNARIRDAVRRAKGEAAGLAAADDPKRPTRAELLAIRAKLLAKNPGGPVGVRTLAKHAHTSPSTVFRRLRDPDIGTPEQLVEHRPERRRSS
jgi:hypothetical protein